MYKFASSIDVRLWKSKTVPERDPVRLTSESFAKLLVEARSGSKAALGQLLEHYRPSLLAAARERLPDGIRPRVGASELVQESFINAEQKIADFQGSGEAELTAWLREILSNEIKLAIRHEKAKKRDLTREVRTTDETRNNWLEELVADQSTPSRHAMNNEFYARLQLVLAKLPEDSQQVIQLRISERLPWREIGARLSRSPEAARKLWARSIIQLQQLLSSKDDSR